MIIPDETGKSDFSDLQKELRRGRTSDKLVMFAFDLLYLNGNDLRKAPLIERKAHLAILLKGRDILLSQHFDTDGASIFKAACEMGIEGIVSKRRDSRYQSDRTND